MGYRVLYDNQLLFDPYTDDRITDTKLSSKLNAAAYFDFTIAPTHSLYSKLAERAGEVRIYFNNLILYKGEITKIDEDFEGNDQVSCTGVLDYLTATRVRPYSTIKGEQTLTCPATIDGYFQWLIDQHNSNCLDSRKRFSVGVNQGNMLDKNNYIYRASEQRPTTGAEIEDKILDSKGGYLFVRYQDDLNIVDLYADVHDVNTQIIDYGVNILDFTKTVTAESQYTAVVATGYTPDPPDGQTDVKMKPITLEGYADGVTPYSSTIVKMGDRVYDVDAVNRYGYREYYVSNTDIKTYDGLLEYACKTLNTLLSPATTISVRAVDLALIMGKKYQHLQLGQAVRVRSKPRKVDEYLMVNSIELDLMNPENTVFVLGASYDTLTGQQSAYLKALNSSINASLDTMDALGTDVKNSAKIAQEAKEKAETATETATDAAAKADKVTDTANSAVTKAETAISKADTAISTSTETQAKVTLVEKQATEAKNAADTAKKAADDATTAANSAQTSATKANEAASAANTAASNAQTTADSALSSANKANEDVGSVKTQITEINKEMTSVKQDAATLRDDLTGQITTVKETMEADYAKKSELSDTETNLKTEISKSAAGIRTEVSQTYSTKKELETTDSKVTNLSNKVEKDYATKSSVTQLSDRIDQTVSSVEEVRTDASAAKTTADNAKKAADDAAAAANTAHETATAAQTAANTAKEHATAASTAASTAKANADAAQAAADKANAALSDAQKNLTDLQNRADVTDEELTAAKNAVATAQSAADSANSAASKAKELANTAQSTANTAKQNADAAQTKANAAASAASTAQSTADTAKANAKKAQDDVDALKNRVTQAETKITQNSEAIALRATKTEVTSAVDNIQVGGRNLLLETEKPYTVIGDGASSRNQVIVPYSLVTGLDAFKGKYLTMSFHIASTENASGELMVQSAGPGWDHLFGIPIDTDLSKVGTSGIDIIGVAKYSTNDNGYQIRLDRAVGSFTFTKMKLELGNKPTDWTPAPEDLQADAATKANAALSESKKYTDAQLKITSDSITSSVSSTYTPKQYPDTRNDNQTPNWYVNHYPRQSITEFKKCSAIGLSGDTFCSLLTEVPWDDASGGYPKQTASVLNKRYWRVGTNGSTWGAWNDVTGLATTANSNASTALSTANSANGTASTANSTANSVKSDLANNYTTTKDSLKTYYLGSSNPVPGWIELGTLTSSGDNSSVTINVYSGNGYNSSASQNSDWQIFIKDGYQAPASISAKSAFGVTVNYGLNCDGVRVEVRATSHNVCDVWCYFPWSYPQGRYTIQGRYSKWEHKSDRFAPLSTIPDGGVAQSIIQETWTTVTNMQSSINQTAESIKSTVAATYVNNQTLSSYATKSQLEQTSTSLTSRIQTTETTVSGMSTTVKNVNDYMTFARESNQPTLTIGSSSSSFRTKLTNTGEKFMQGDQTIMELDGVTSTVKASRVQLGHYQWRDTGTSMQLVYIP